MSGGTSVIPRAQKCKALRLRHFNRSFGHDNIPARAANTMLLILTKSPRAA
jgi:hypothetical protein